jgi:hypothetical protein
MIRALTYRERAALDRLLEADFPGVEALREQAKSAQGCGRAMVTQLRVDDILPRASVTERQPVQAVVKGRGYDGGLLLFVEDGRLDWLEYWWVTDEMPDDFPPLDAIGPPVARKP